MVNLERDILQLPVHRERKTWLTNVRYFEDGKFSKINLFTYDYVHRYFKRNTSTYDLLVFEFSFRISIYIYIYNGQNEYNIYIILKVKYTFKL